MRALSVRSLVRIMASAMMLLSLTSGSRIAAGESDEIRLFSPATAFKMGEITIHSAAAPDLTGEYKLPGLQGSAALLSVVQDGTGRLVGNATLRLANQSYGPISLNGELSASCASPRFNLTGELRPRHDAADSPGAASRDQVAVKIHGYKTGDTFAVFVRAEVDGRRHIRSRFVGNISPGAGPATKTIVLEDTPAYQDHYGSHYRTERTVTCDGAPAGTVRAAQINYRNFVLFQAQTSSDAGEELKVKLYGFVHKASFNVVMARIETSMGRAMLSPSAVNVSPSAFSPADLLDERNDDIITMIRN